jgi:hypothetical protein
MNLKTFSLLVVLTVSLVLAEEEKKPLGKIKKTNLDLKFFKQK